MDDIHSMLVIGPDPALVEEVQAAFSGIPGLRVLVHHVPDLRHVHEALRSRRPELAFVALPEQPDGLPAIAEEAGTVSPETIVVAVLGTQAYERELADGAAVIRAVRAGVQDFLRRPLSTREIEQVVHRQLRRKTVRTGRLGKVVSFVSNKGGVGKSTLSVNAACGLAQHHPGRVLLIDGSLQMGVCSVLLDLNPTTTITDLARQSQRLDERLIRDLATPHPLGLHLIPCPNDAVEACDIDDEVMARIINLARRSYDYVILDSFPMLDRVMMAVIDLSDAVYVVTESVVPTIRGGMKMLQLLAQLGIPESRRRIILNRYSNFAGNLRAKDVAAYFGQPVDHVIPYEKKLLIAANTGRPLIASASRWSGFRRAMLPLIQEIEAVMPGAAASRSSAAARNQTEPSPPPVEESSTPADESLQVRL